MNTLKAQALSFSGRLRGRECESPIGESIRSCRQHDYPELAALQVLVNVAADLAGDIQRAEAELSRRRDGLIDLRMLLSREQRRLDRYRPLAVRGPPVLAIPGAVAPDTDWSATFARLLSDPEATP
jgi:hypothetical protein